MKGKLQLVWRVENAKGRGPYAAHPESAVAARLQSLGYNKLESAMRPGPAHDKALAAHFAAAAGADRKDWIFGFQSLDLYHDWFADDHLRRLMTQQNYFLTGYVVPRDAYIEGSRQALFQRAQAAVREFRDCQGQVLMRKGAGQIMPAMRDLLRHCRLDVV